MGKKSRQKLKQQQKLQQQQLEDPASLFPWCSWCGKEDHRWRACPEEPPADWCGCCEEDRHNWAGCSYVPAQASAATPVAPVRPGSPHPREIWEWLMDAEGELCSDLPLAINALWFQDGEQWEAWERQHHPASLHETTAMVLHYLAQDMAEIPTFQVPEWVELPSCEPEGVELLSTEPEGEDPTLQYPEREEKELPSPELEGEELQAQLPVFFWGEEWKDSPPLLSEEPAAFPLLSEEPAAFPLLSEEPAAFPLLSEEPAAFPLLLEEPAAFPLLSAAPPAPALPPAVGGAGSATSPSPTPAVGGAGSATRGRRAAVLASATRGRRAAVLASATRGRQAAVPVFATRGAGAASTSCCQQGRGTLATATLAGGSCNVGHAQGCLPRIAWGCLLLCIALGATGCRVRGRSGALAAAFMARGSPPEFASRGSAAAVASRGSAATVASRGSCFSWGRCQS
ncbi:UNVERIFIED_CONTAM: hypothetical protein FKN15_013813 [Acipenser sinensis]